MVQTIKDDNFEEYRGKLIRKILFDTRDVYSTPVTDIKNETPHWYGKIGNILHYKTKNWVVNGKLLFAEGDTLDPYLIQESERLLRESGIYVDVRIYVTPVKSNDTLIDLKIVTQDRWSMILPISYNPENKSGFVNLKETNFFGLGHQLEGRIDYFKNPELNLDLSANYRAANILGTFIDGAVNYISDKKAVSREIVFERKFFSTTTRWAGGLNFQWNDDVDEIYDGNLKTLNPLKWQEHSLWIGRAFGLNFGNLDFQKKSKFVLTGKYSYLKHTNRPRVNSDSLQMYQNSHLVLGGLGFVNRNYFKDFYINGFGVTEDVPVGGILKFIGGFENREFSNRYYSGLSGSVASRFKNYGYLSFNFDIGGFYRKIEWEQNTFRFSAKYFSSLVEKNNWKFRFFARNETLFGYNRFEGENIILDQDSGMRQFENSDLIGTKRIVLSLDGNVFSPYKLLGFVLGGNIFGDFGTIGNNLNDLKKGHVYNTIGIGFRIRNESLSMNSTQIALTYSSIDTESGRGSFGVLFTSNFFGLGSFSISQPNVLKFVE